MLFIIIIIIAALVLLGLLVVGMGRAIGSRDEDDRWAEEAMLIAHCEGSESVK